MKIAIITLPLHTNYGGIVQAYALRKVLQELGHEVHVIDKLEKMPLPLWYKAPFVYSLRALKKVFSPSAKVEVFRELNFRKELPVMATYTQKFVDECVAPRMVRKFADIREGEYDAFIVGSDQVWRPRYFGKVEDAFLKFTSGWDVKRVSYAASFGTDQLEYEYELLQQCTDLLKEFDAVSVREDVAVGMCEEWFSREDAVQVADPVLLLTAEHYAGLAQQADEHSCKGNVATYILDPSKEKQCVVDFAAKITGKEVQPLYVDVRDRSLSLKDRVVPPVQQWIAGFYDADFVVTDSFHGCVLSILLHKPFIAVGNSLRGMARLQSLLNMFGLDGRLVQGIDPEDDGEYWLEEPDWDAVDAILATKREEAVAFLVNALK